MEALATQPEMSLAQRWQRLREEQPKLRIRNAAEALGVSELELLLCREDGVQPLKPVFGGLLSAMDDVGDVMILTRNDQVVHEVTASFRKFTVAGKGTMGLAVGDIDIRVFLNQWAYGYLVTESVGSITRESLQFFSDHGQALHKIYKTSTTNRDAWDRLLGNYLDKERPFPELLAAPVREPRADAEAVDVAALRNDWSGLKDVHHFHAMLKRNNVDRLTAVEVVGKEWVTRLKATTLETHSPLDAILEQVKSSHCPIMVFVGNPGIVQIFTGTVGNLKRTGPWMNVLDKGFNLHANTYGIRDWFVVRRPSADGTVTSLEGYNAQGDIVITLFGKRKPGQPESTDWQREVATLESALCE
ncbi:hemin-degrading factor [Marinobacter sp. 1_MG-2023]|uniref:hemin-degrading factor n=1 Tax=Marinobacter sp. 1_MG-2023 TaxID=3062627 RepID=UPI0026E1F294|nr:ChuX/HutX family heme-like substrate-binding protein [Marinobacter sp. 1_MG-2023]MDO6822700.1 ChuX/HutX family heme-like substrate-binding protein [Marinobacter sp. 1_MG-2023]